MSEQREGEWIMTEPTPEVEPIAQLIERRNLALREETDQP